MTTQPSETRYGVCPTCYWNGAVNRDGQIRQHRQLTADQLFGPGTQSPNQPICEGGMAEAELSITGKLVGPRTASAGPEG